MRHRLAFEGGADPSARLRCLQRRPWTTAGSRSQRVKLCLKTPAFPPLFPRIFASGQRETSPRRHRQFLFFVTFQVAISEGKQRLYQRLSQERRNLSCDLHTTPKLAGSQDNQNTNWVEAWPTTFHHCKGTPSAIQTFAASQHEWRTEDRC